MKKNKKKNKCRVLLELLHQHGMEEAGAWGCSSENKKVGCSFFLLRLRG